MKLLGKKALITGAASGLGREIALTFAREGADVAINDVRREGAEAVAREIEALGRQSLRLPADISDSIEVRALFEELVDRWQVLDILVNNAGIVLVNERVQENFGRIATEMLAGGPIRTSLEAASSMSDTQWRRTLAVHLDGTFYSTREALKIMEPRGSGKIIHMASIAGTVGLPISPEYSAAKAGIIGFTKAVARDVITRGIYVNAIAPGFIDTPFLDVMSEGMKRLALMQTPIGRLGTPAEVAAVALFLASDDSSFMVGQVLSPNGGYAV